MREPDKDILEQQKKAAAFLTRPWPRIEQKSPKTLAAEAKAAADEEARLEAEFWADKNPGDRMADGSVYAGLSSETSRRIFAMPGDAGGAMTFNEAAVYARKANTEKISGHDDWRVATKDDLYTLYKNRQKGALKNSFNMASPAFNWYWSSTLFDDNNAYIQRFANGDVNRERISDDRSTARSVRLVRG